MRRRRQLVTSFVVACALTAASVTAASASAERLELTEPGGAPVARGAIAVNEDTTFSSAGSCLEESPGTVLKNGRETDHLSFEPPLHVECAGEESVSGGVGSVRLTSFGVMRLRMNPKMAITLPGPCVYELKTLEGSLSFPDIAYITGEATGKRNKKASIASCAKTTTIEFAAGEFGLEASYVFATELIA